MEKTFSREELCRVWLQSVDSLSWRKQEAMLIYFGSAEEIFDQLGGAMLAFAGEKAYASMVRLKNEGLDALADKLNACGAIPIVRGREGYPSLLNEIPDPPHVLFLRGTALPDNKSVAIVGSRRETRYGRTQAYNIAKELAANGITVVSGLARGIDTAAHEGALAAGGRTVAVLGNGIDSVYPPENKDLASRIAASGGAVVTEFPFGEKPEAYHFPIRNRIISGMSAALLLVEGHARSGTMITAGYAAEQGREVFALPGMVDAPGSAAPLRLLREGAGLCTSAKDILSDMGWLRGVEESKKEAPASDGAKLSAEQQRIAQALAAEPLYFEELVEKTGLAPDALTGELAVMELDGIVESRAGRAYALLQNAL